jgi:hypothetical protein
MHLGGTAGRVSRTQGVRGSEESKKIQIFELNHQKPVLLLTDTAKVWAVQAEK